MEHALEGGTVTRREIWLAQGQHEFDPQGLTACMTHIRMVPCETCDAATGSLQVLWSQRVSDIQHVRNEEAWRNVR